MSWIDEMIDGYYQWLRKNTTTEEGRNGWHCIDTPFMGAFNDSIEIYIQKKEDLILLSDDGETLNNLELQGVNIQGSKKRREIIDDILLNYGVKKKENSELILEANEKSFPQKKHNLLTAILEISDLSVLSKHNVLSIFKEDVRTYLDELDINYTAEFISKGATGLEFAFDFQIAKREKEIVIKSFNSINKSMLGNFLFSWDDIKPVRQRVAQKDIHAIAMINDIEKSIGEEYLKALTSKGADYILWSKKNAPVNKNKIVA